MSIAHTSPTDLPAHAHSWENLVSRLDPGRGLGAGHIQPDKLSPVRPR